MEYIYIWNSGIIGIFPENHDFSNFLGVLGVPEGFREVSGGGTLHPDRIRARTERYGPKSTRCS